MSVDSGGSAEINGGAFSEIWAFDISGTAIALSSLLSDGYAFYDQTNGEVQNGTATKLTNVTVKKHTHSGSPCACGPTGDAGLVVYAAMALSSCTGTALLLRRKRMHE